jgi:hypothetical protein
VDQGCITNTTNWNLLQLPISNNDDGGGNLICTSSLREPEIPEVKNTQKTGCNQGRNQALCFFIFLHLVWWGRHQTLSIDRFVKSCRFSCMCVVFFSAKDRE